MERARSIIYLKNIIILSFIDLPCKFNDLKHSKMKKNKNKNK